MRDGPINERTCDPPLPPARTLADDMSHRIYQAIVDAIPDMIIRISREGIFQSFEGASAELYWPADAYLGKHLKDVLPADTAALFLEKIARAFETGRVQYLDYRLSFDGKERFYESRMITCSPQDALAIVRNVSEKKRTEAQLLRYQEDLEDLVQERTADLVQAEKKYRRIFNHSGSPSIIVDQDFTISMANPKFEDLTGYERSAIEGRMQWIDFIAPQGRKRVKHYHYERRSGKGQVPSEYECQIVDRHGKLKDIFIKVGMLPEPGRSIASLIDITSLKETEKHLREREALYSAMLEGYEGLLYIISKDYRIKFMNENLVRFIGRNATGEICYEALHHRQTKCLWCVSDQVFDGACIRFEMKNPNDKKWYYSVNVPIRMTGGSVYCQAMISDIDQRKRMEDIPLLIDHFLKAYDRKMRPQISDQVMESLLAYDWPGNVRELQNVLYRFVTFKRLDLTGETQPAAPAPAAMAALDEPLPDDALSTLSEATAHFEKQLITSRLDRCRWNRTRTAKDLGIGLRTLQRKMKYLGIQ